MQQTMNSSMQQAQFNQSKGSSTVGFTRISGTPSAAAPWNAAAMPLNAAVAPLNAVAELAADRDGRGALKPTTPRPPPAAMARPPSAAAPRPPPALSWPRVGAMVLPCSHPPVKPRRHNVEVVAGHLRHAVLAVVVQGVRRPAVEQSMRQAITALRGRLHRGRRSAEEQLPPVK
uniref:Uncharacterized protein n=1 Tax=Arundo donax TaxID=35708 RepID=A0A0A9AQV9_ARUDO